VLYNDFLGICYGDRALADALRGFEVKACRRAGYLIERYAIPDGSVPHDDDMWFELSLRQLQALTLGAQSKSTYARTVAEIPVPRTEDDEVAPPSLLSLGYIERRYIARPADDLPRVPEVPTTMYRDDKGVFIIVSREGCYVGYDEVLHYAPFEGYSQIVTQYRYCDTKVNAALALAQWLDPPEPAPRWKPITKRRKGAIIPDETTNPQHDSASVSNDSLQISANEQSAVRGGILEPANQRNSFTFQNITTTNALSMAEAAPEAQNSHVESENSTQIGLSKSGQGCPTVARGVQPWRGASNRGRNKNQNQSKNLSVDSQKDSAPTAPSFSLYRNTLDFEQIREAPWNADTVVKLLSAALAIPAPSEVSKDAWRTECLEPAQRLMEKTAHLDCARAWEMIDTVSRYMATPGSPSWWQRPISEGGRVTKSPVMPKNVADRFDAEWNDFKCHAHLWHPESTTPYDGPPLTDYERGYGGVEVAPPADDTAPTAAFGDQAENCADPTTDEVPAVQIAASPPEPVAPLYAMSREEAADLADLIAAKSPQISLGCQEYDDGSFAICIEHAEDAWITLRKAADWYAPPPIVERLIEKALVFGESRAGGAATRASKENDVGAESGAIMEEMRTT
jgi:hypothetical protein